MQWKIINKVLNFKQDVCVVMATGKLFSQWNILGFALILSEVQWLCQTCDPKVFEHSSLGHQTQAKQG